VTGLGAVLAAPRLGEAQAFAHPERLIIQGTDWRFPNDRKELRG
jgi:hypothetical protein